MTRKTRSKQAYMNIFTSVRRFKCSLCDKAYTRQSSLNRHFLSHEISSGTLGDCERHHSPEIDDLSMMVSIPVQMTVRAGIIGGGSGTSSGKNGVSSVKVSTGPLINTSNTSVLYGYSGREEEVSQLLKEQEHIITCSKNHCSESIEIPSVAISADCSNDRWCHDCSYTTQSVQYDSLPVEKGMKYSPQTPHPPSSLMPPDRVVTPFNSLTGLHVAQSVQQNAQPVKNKRRPLPRVTTDSFMHLLPLNPVIVSHDTPTGRGFKCCLCGKVLTRISTYKDHMNLHTGAHPYTCDKCNRSFNQYSQKRFHMKNHHN